MPVLGDQTGRARRIASHDRVTEAVVLSTCERLETYVSTRTPDDLPAAIQEVRSVLDTPAEPTVEHGLDAIEHLTRVACGLESTVPGEDHVLGQVRRAFGRADDAGVAGGVLSRASDAAVRVGRRCRAETEIDEGHASYATVTCDLLAEDGSPPEHVVVVGAGEIGSSVARAVQRRFDARVDVVNRSIAPELSSADGRAWPLSDLGSALENADGVVTATGAPDPVLCAEDARNILESATVVDLANPPDVAPEVRSSRPVTGLTTVQQRIRETVARREQAVPDVESMVADAVEGFVVRERENAAEDTIRALHRRAASIRETELDRAKDQLADGDAQPEDVLEAFGSALVGSILGTPTERLRIAAREGDDAVIDVTHRLFDIEATNDGSCADQNPRSDHEPQPEDAPGGDYEPPPDHE